MHWHRKPPLHFVAIGMALFALERYERPAQEPPRPTVIITAAALGQLEADARRGNDGALDRAALVDRAVEEEILYREALARGLDRDDQSIRFRLAEKMRFLLESEHEERSEIDGTDLYREALALGLDREDPLVRGILVHKMRLLLKRTSGAPVPGDEALQAYLNQHRERYLQPARVTFDHVFLGGERHALEDAGRLLDRLRARPMSASQAARLGTPFPLGVHFERQSAQDLTRIFGTEFAATVVALAPGTWTAVRSPFGVHLVRVEQKQEARLPDLEVVRSRVRAQLVEERQEARLADQLQALRAKYAIRVEPTAGGPG